MKDCIFCKIVAGDIPSYKVYEDDRYFAFLDISQVNNGHILLIPKKHVRWVWDIPKIGEFFQVAKKMVLKVQEVTRKDFVFTQTIGRLVPHAHLHIVPETEGNLESVIEAWGEALEKRKVSPERMKELAKMFRLEEG